MSDMGKKRRMMARNRTLTTMKLHKNGCQEMSVQEGSEGRGAKGGGGKSTARSRREKENWEFGELARLLPFPSAITSQLDKASIIRLTTSYLNLRNVFPHGFGTWWLDRYAPRDEDIPEIHEFGSHFMQTLDGFVFVLSPLGKIMYMSETASVHLGLSQVELIGSSLYDYVHPDDQTELHQVLQTPASESCNALIDAGMEEFEVQRVFFLRMKCVLAKRNAGLTDHGFKVIHCTGYMKFKHCNTLEAGTGTDGCIDNLGLVATGYTLPPTSATEIRLSPYMFMFRASLDFKIVFLDSRVSDLTGFDLQELLDKSIYDLIHVADLEEMKNAHKILIEKHQSTTSYYRLLVKGGGWMWVQTQLTLIHIPRASRPSCIVGVSYSMSSTEFAGVVMEEMQKTGGKNGSIFPSVSGRSDSASSNQTLGAYSEQFYGPNGMLLVQPPAYETQSPGPLAESAHHRSKYRRKRHPFQYKDALTGERRYCLRETTQTEPQVPETHQELALSDMVLSSLPLTTLPHVPLMTTEQHPAALIPEHHSLIQPSTQHIPGYNFPSPYSNPIEYGNYFMMNTPMPAYYSAVPPPDTNQQQAVYSAYPATPSSSFQDIVTEPVPLDPYAPPLPQDHSQQLLSLNSRNSVIIPSLNVAVSE